MLGSELQTEGPSRRNFTTVTNDTTVNSTVRIDVPKHAFDLLELEGEEIVLCIAGLFMLAFVLGNVLHIHHVNCVPESLVVIALGAAGAAIWTRFLDEHRFNIKTDAVINKQLLSMFFLPIIIFEAGWSVRNKEFISQLPYILIFAVFGTVICMLVVASLTIATRDYHHVKSIRTAFAYGALISAVDPVATLATYAHLNVEPLLNILVMGESIVNDAVAIVLFEVLNTKPRGYFEDEPNGKIVRDIVLEVIVLLGASIFIGLGLGIFYSAVLRFAKMRHSPSLAILFILVSAYFTYHFAETLCGKSGIIAVLFNGMIMSATASPHLSTEGALLTSFLLKQLSSLADMSVFLFVGFAAILIQRKGFNYSLWAMLFCLVGRGLATFPLAAICNLIKAHTSKGLEPEKRLMLSSRHMFMMWHAGLRGGIALVLTLSLSTKWIDEEEREVLCNATVAIIIAFLLVFGGSTEFCLKRLKIPIGNPPPMYLQWSGAMTCLYAIHRRVIKPVLKGHRPKERHMEGGIFASVLKEEKIKDRSELARAQAESGTLGLRMNLFGRTDPLRLQRGWTRSDPNQEGWRRQAGCCDPCSGGGSSSDDELSGENSLDSLTEDDVSSDSRSLEEASQAARH
mmetsp:Transcript_80550/g.240086  ORF Transcript_80550/g.240086 Transcript_80550/m.240086 type:complete len:626 (+) Transcript_80550:38-1915(+)